MHCYRCFCILPLTDEKWFGAFRRRKLSTGLWRSIVRGQCDENVEIYGYAYRDVLCGLMMASANSVVHSKSAGEMATLTFDQNVRMNVSPGVSNSAVNVLQRSSTLLRAA